jgi:hypothetical protein
MAKVEQIGSGPGPGHMAREALEALTAELDPSATLYLDVPLPELAGRSYRLDALWIGSGGLHLIECPELGGRVESGPWDWRLGDGQWIRSPTYLARLKLRALARAIRAQVRWTGRMPLRAAVFLARPGVELRPSSTQGAAAAPIPVVTRATIRKWLTRTNPIEPDLSRLSEALRQSAGAWRGLALERLPRPDRLGPFRILAELTVDRGHRINLAEEGLGGPTRLLRTVELLGGDADHRPSPDLAAWEASILQELGRQDGFPRFGRASMDSNHRLWQSLELTEGACASTWAARHCRSGAAPPIRGAAALARAVATLHDNGLVHGRLGPLAVRVEDCPDPERVWLDGLDLLAQPEPGGGAEIWDREEDRFLAPEVLLGWSPPSPASDQFGLGVALAVLAGGALQGTWSGDLEPYAMSGTFGEVVRRLIAPRPIDRFRSIHEAAVVLEQLVPRPRRLPRAVQPDPGPELELVDLVHVGSRSSIYTVREKASGVLRALKVAHAGQARENALRHEAQVLSRLSHPRLPRCHGTGTTSDGRFTLLLDWIPGESLAAVLRRGELPEPEEGRRMGQDLLDVLLYLHREGVVHGSLEPGHLILGDAHLHLIDFSGEEARAALRYRDPAGPAAAGSAAQDLYAAALCLFELWTGEAPFRSGGPRPDEEPALEPELFDGFDGGHMAGFFRRALHPDPASRFASVREMRAALVAVQRFARPPAPVREVEALRNVTSVSTQSSIEALALGPAARRALRYAGVQTVGGLAALDELALERLPRAGRSVRKSLLALRSALLAVGIRGDEAQALDPPLAPGLANDEGEMEALEVSPGLRERLTQAGFKSIGALALHGRGRLRALPGIGPSGFARILRALAVRLARSRRRLAEPATLDELWSALAGALDGKERAYLEARYGLLGAEPRAPKVLARKLGLHSAGTPGEHLLAALVPEVLIEASAVVERRILAEEAPVFLEELGAALDRRWPRDGEIEPEPLAGLLCTVLGIPVYEHRRLRRAWVDPAASTMERTLSLAAAAQRLAGIPQAVRPEAARRELLDAVLLAGESAPDFGLRDLLHLGRKLAPAADPPDLGSGLQSPEAAAAGEGAAGTADEVLARWICQGVAWIQSDPLTQLQRSFGTEGALLGWVLGGGRAEELVEAGLLLSTGEPLPVQVALRGLRKSVARIKPPLPPAELQGRTSALAARTLAWLGRPLDRSLDARAERKGREAGLRLSSGGLLRAAWRHRCNALARRLADGGLPAAGELEELGRHRARDEGAEELELLEEMCRMARFLASARQAEGDLDQHVARAVRHLAHADRCAARIRLAQQRTPQHRLSAASVLERYRIAHDREAEAFARCLAQAPGEALQSRRPEILAPRVLAPLLQDSPALWIVLPAAPFSAVLDLIEDLAAPDGSRGVRSLEIGLALGSEPPHPPSKGLEVHRLGTGLASDEHLGRALASLPERPVCLWMDDFAQGLRRGPGSPGLVRASGFRGLRSALRRADEAAVPVILSTDGGSTPYWPGAARLGPGAPPRGRQLARPEAPPEGWIAIPTPGSPAAGFAWALGAHRGPARAGYRGGASPAEVLAPVIVLAPGAGVPPEPPWWHEAGGALRDPPRRRAQNGTEEELREPLDAADTPRSRETASRESGADAPIQLELGLLGAAPAALVAMPAGLDETESSALREIAESGVASAHELALRLGISVSATMGRVARLHARLISRGLGLLSISRDASGVPNYKIVDRQAWWPPAGFRAEPDSSRIPPPFLWDLEDAGQGKSALRLVSSLDLLSQAQEWAIGRDFAVSWTEAAPPGSLLAEALCHLRTAALEPGALADLLAWWLLEAEEAPPPESEHGLRETPFRLAAAHLEDSPFDLPRLLDRWRGWLDAAEWAPAQALLAWLCGAEPAPVLRRAGVTEAIGEQRLTWVLRLCLSCLRQTGHRGWLVAVDCAAASADAVAKALCGVAHAIENRLLPGLVLAVRAPEELLRAGPDRLAELGRFEPDPGGPEPAAQTQAVESQEPARPVELSLFEGESSLER